MYQLDYNPSQAKQSQAGCKSTTALPIPDLPDPDPDPDLLSTINGPLQMLISNSFLNQSWSNFGFYISLPILTKYMIPHQVHNPEAPKRYQSLDGASEQTLVLGRPHILLRDHVLLLHLTPLI